MKIYVITDNDLNRLILRIDRNPQHGEDGGSSRGTPTPEQRKAEEEAHRFFNYQVRCWMSEVTEGDRKIS